MSPSWLMHCWRCSPRAVVTCLCFLFACACGCSCVLGCSCFLADLYGVSAHVHCERCSLVCGYAPQLTSPAFGLSSSCALVGAVFLIAPAHVPWCRSGLPHACLTSCVCGGDPLMHMLVPRLVPWLLSCLSECASARVLFRFFWLCVFGDSSCPCATCAPHVRHMYMIFLLSPVF